MKASKIFGMALDNLKQRKLRTSLTTLGVVIGITAIIGLAALGEGFRFGIKERMEQGFELRVLVVLPIGAAGTYGHFRLEEVEKIKKLEGVELVTPMNTITKMRIANKENTTLNVFTLGAVNFSEITQMIPERLTPIAGEIPSPEENDTIVLGYKTCYLNETAPLVHVGDNVTVLAQIDEPPYYVNKTFRVGAILGKSGVSAITNFDYWVFVPFNAVADFRKVDEYNVILVKVIDPENSEQVAKAVENVFENPYSISIIVPIAFMRQVDRILNFVQLFLLAIASISLLVAGIGIMNIMMVSVMERTREIGILKAIGAKSRTVLAMFLAEATLIGLLGGLIGIFTGYGLSYGLAYGLSNFMQPQQGRTALRNLEAQQALKITPMFSPEWTIIAFIFAIIICIIFGLYPARKAAKLNPVEALRYE